MFYYLNFIPTLVTLLISVGEKRLNLIEIALNP